ncbi:Cysteinyl-tRNA synthetase [Cystobacter fuscus DSM 2262]|uniref:Cysteine--tRNA ligase n=1 Tax=Cystobacter fuscus (strain ATCC 25194 / DSM 2262 / NBRC 100088 / M29) TaxID=1242864 RepID=S9PMN2_CYSF2|nr:cysteine--tRNA ligase [Cystobacter fuscus]EPX63707.1 Cysteinyl-tRNA synthetase [Cystobacter fuscus DSM 2262]
MAAASIRLFNTMTMQKETLVPVVPGKLGVYVCGPTVYSYVHIGNARTFTSFDVVVRYLRHRGFEVTYVRNYTDVDDKIIKAAQETGEAPVALAARFVEAFREDARALHLLEPDVSPKVSDHIPEILRIIGKLVDKGVAYASQGDVYFSVRRYPDYAKLSKRDLDELCVGERVQPGEQKHEPLDFALWKAAKPGEPSWDSPWGPGRPGWHIECSAMSERYLGETFDIHGGGLDLIFPHHENELAQSEAASGHTLARYWMHCGFLDLEGAKMSKSLGNVVRLREALERVDAEALRFFFLSTHYRHPLAFSDKGLADAELRMEYFYETLRKVDERVGGKEFAPGPLHGDAARFMADFEAQMDDDFNSAGALGVLSGLFAMMNELVDKPPVKDKAVVGRTLRALREDVRKVSGILGLFEEAPASWLLRRRDRAVKERGLDVARVEQLMAARAEARKAKDFAEADRLRVELKSLGVEIMDTAAGTLWKVAAPA